MYYPNVLHYLPQLSFFQHVNVNCEGTNFYLKSQIITDHNQSVQSVFYINGTLIPPMAGLIFNDFLSRVSPISVVFNGIQIYFARIFM